MKEDKSDGACIARLSFICINYSAAYLFDYLNIKWMQDCYAWRIQHKINLSLP